MLHSACYSPGQGYINTWCIKLTWNIFTILSKPPFPLPRQSLALERILLPGILLQRHPNLSCTRSMSYCHYPHTLACLPVLGGPITWQGQWLSRAFYFVLSKVLDTQSSPVHLFSCDPYSSSEKSQDWFYLFLAEQADVTLSTHPGIHPGIPSTSGGYHFLPILRIRIFWMPVDTEVAEPHPRVSDSAGLESSMRICF